MFVVPISNAKNVEEMKFHIDAPMLKYWQSKLNSCCFSSLESSFDSINKINSTHVLSKRIEESLTSKVGFRNSIDFKNDVLKNWKRIKGEQTLYYKLNMFKQKGYFNISNNISEHVTLVQLMDYLVNVNHSISVFGY